MNGVNGMTGRSLLEYFIKLFFKSFFLLFNHCFLDFNGFVIINAKVGKKLNETRGVEIEG